MPKKRKSTTTSRRVSTLKHKAASRTNIPTAEYEAVLDPVDQEPVRVAFERRNRDLDPQLVWRGKDVPGPAELMVQAPPLFIQEKVHPKVLVDDLERETRRRRTHAEDERGQPDFFADFNGLPSDDARTEFYQHDANWSNRMILGDSLQVMASLAEREGLRGKVQCIYLDPPYGIKFNSNFQWSTTSRDVKDGKAGHITREPEQVKAFRDTWRDGIHSYLTYLRNRLTVGRELLTKTGSIFVQIGEENVHRVRTLMDEVFGASNCVREIAFRKTSPLEFGELPRTYDSLLWYAKSKEHVKYHQIFLTKDAASKDCPPAVDSDNSGEKPKHADLKSSGYTPSCTYDFTFRERVIPAQKKSWRTHKEGMQRLIFADRMHDTGRIPRYKQYTRDFALQQISNMWSDTSGARNMVYVVQTHELVIQRCILMTTDPGDLVLDPTCGAGTTSYVSEQWGRRWITTDTSRVALALARARIMGARYPWYLLRDSPEGQQQEAEVTGKPPSEEATQSDIRLGFVYCRVPRITLESIANNSEVDTIWERWQETLEPLREDLNALLSQNWEEWQIPRETDQAWPQAVMESHRRWRQARISRQQEIDSSIADRADVEYRYDKPYDDPNRVRVAGPFTVESLSPHRLLAFNEADELIDRDDEQAPAQGTAEDFAAIALGHLATCGVQQAQKADRITFSSIDPWPGERICAEGRYTEGEDGPERRAAIVIGPEFGTVSRQDLVRAAREAADAGFDVLIACAFNFEPHATEFNKLGALPVLKARMNADLHMADDLANTGKGNLFVVFGEPDITIRPADGDHPETGRIQVQIHGVDVFHPSTGEVRSDGPDEIACWFIDTDYNDESFFVRQAYFLGANDPYKALRTTLKAEIDEEAWATLHSDTSRPFDRPESERIAVKVINHLGDEVMKVFCV